MTVLAPQAQPPTQRRIRHTRRALIGWAVSGVLAAAVAAPVHATTKPKPQTVSLRLGSVNQSTRLIAPGLAMSRATRTLMPGESLTFTSEPLRRLVTIDSHPFLRLHLSHSVPGDVVLYVTIQAVGSEGTRVLLPSHAVTATDAVLSAGPQANADFRLPHVVGTLNSHEQLELVLSELASGVPDSLHPDMLTVYLGALPNEDTDIHDIGQVNDEARGGKNPARISLSVSGTGPFQEW